MAGSEVIQFEQDVARLHRPRPDVPLSTQSQLIVMADQVLGKRTRSSSPPTGGVSGQPEAKRSINTGPAVTDQEDVPIEIANGDSNGNEAEGAGDDDEDDDDDDIGPMPDMPGDGAGETGKGKKKSKKAVLPHEKLYLEHLPSANRYYKSFMHRDQINFVTMTKTNFLITTSLDGHVKLWKKQEDSIEFVKHYRASLSAIVGVSADSEGKVFATVSEKGEGRVFDVVNFDMINILKLDYTPKTCCWVHHPSDGRTLLAMIYDGRGDGKPLHTIEKLHRDSVHLMTYSPQHDCVISADEAGFVEYWRPREPWSIPDDIRGMWQFKSQTDLFEFKKAKSIPTSITLSPNSSHFVTLSLPDRQVRIFNFLTGKKTRQYDESLAAIEQMQQAGTAVQKLDAMEFYRRMAVERELGKNGEGETCKGGMLRTANAVWDETGNFILYPTLLGIKAYKKQRFYIFSRSEPEDTKGGDRDIFNEKPTREEQSMAMVSQPAHSQASLGTSCIIHTTKGDIHFQLYPDLVPKTVENFVTHAKNGYYNGIIFHRVIKKFMLQTGDPLGDGTGGESIWGHEFEDEFVPQLKHDRPYTLSMANAGPNTNGSQFFITTVPCPWLDNKHTVFGRATAGLDVIHAIEDTRVDKTDKPYEDIKMVSIDIA
ncbi:hypothetical protein QFC19_009018 [Naganishia cerealis]|uniref:Uncharacterized protein n=1 Tax=Naganishia cerealis TaxID=610337 RepID=A0ACC2UXS4_9TREE|nr:hypothetical protein QFC19_009018 [Naganishia cerealis]